jgi:hypothetical protein
MERMTMDGVEQITDMPAPVELNVEAFKLTFV